MKTIDLSGKTALVTGGGQGLGLATATALYGAGANVVLNYFEDSSGSNRQKAEAAANQLGERAFALPADVRDRPAIESMLDTIIERTKRLDIVINNAAIIRDRSLKNMSDSEWSDVIDTNLTGVFNVCKAACTRLADGGRVVSMASVSGSIGFYGQVNYSSAKAGVMALTKVLSKELAIKNITVNAVAPGVVMTEMAQTIPESVQKQMMANIPLQRFGEPEEIANVILFLCSPLASYVTGQTIHVNGGWWG
ncbi:3-oxoacyl-ACP reductase FabG [Schlesneria paludicola]|uniref:3-oxoacyl-ACP reductase FabG n=1 Tax=Schlesneria paludicola TaxID=360056 RepID=UPI00029A19D9|nr:3-oxoacyl-ACP reductase FabG [Schlesneria paludicola]